MSKHYPKIEWCRYADDGVVHCKSEREAQHLLTVLKDRFQGCYLELHPVKTKIVYCKDAKRKGDYPNTMFTFLGYDFRRREVKCRTSNEIFLGFNPAVSKMAQKAMRLKIKNSKLSIRTEISLQEIARKFNPILNGWIGYYGRYAPSELHQVLSYFNRALMKWAGNKYKNMRGHKTQMSLFVQKIAKENPMMFAHWKIGMMGSFV